MHFLDIACESLMKSGKMGLAIIERILTYMLVDSPNVHDIPLDMTETLFYLPVSPIKQSPFMPFVGDQALDVERFSVPMRGVAPDRWREIYIVSKPLALMFMRDLEDGGDQWHRLAELSLVARVLLNPFGESDHRKIWGTGVLGPLQIAIPWIRVAPIDLRPTRYLFSFQDVSTFLYRRKRVVPTTLNYTRLLDVVQKGVDEPCGDIPPIREATGGEFKRKDEPPEPELIDEVVITSQLFHSLRKDYITECNLFAQANKASLKEIDSFNENPDEPHNPVWVCVMRMKTGTWQITSSGSDNSKKRAKNAACQVLWSRIVMKDYD